MLRALAILVLFAPVALSARGPAKNVVLFLADAGGTSTIAAASLYAHGAPRRLFIQKMPHIALAETAAASQIVTDSAAGMTAIVTGEKTHNGVLSQSASAVRGERDGKPLKTILEYAEEHGLSTGIISNDSLAGATPAATYAHVNDRGETAAIIQQAFTPRYGDGVDVMIGSGRQSIVKALDAAGMEIDQVARKHGRAVLSALSDVPADATRTIVLLDSSDFDLDEAIRIAHRILSKNENGYFLMVESDTHTDHIRHGLDRMAGFDRVIQNTAALVGGDTLVLFTADHSFDLRLRGGSLGTPLLEGLEAAEAKAEREDRRDIRIRSLRMDNGHTGEPVLVAAQGPGAARVRGYMDNTDVFRAMMDAFGWTAR